MNAVRERASRFVNGPRIRVSFEFFTPTMSTSSNSLA